MGTPRLVLDTGRTDSLPWKACMHLWLMKGKEWNGMDVMHDTRAFLSWGLSTPVDTFLLIASYFPRVPIIIVFTYLLSLTTVSDPHVLLVIVAAGALEFRVPIIFGITHQGTSPTSNVLQRPSVTADALDQQRTLVCWRPDPSSIGDN